MDDGIDRMFFVTFIFIFDYYFHDIYLEKN